MTGSNQGGRGRNEMHLKQQTKGVISLREHPLWYSDVNIRYGTSLFDS